MLVFIESVKRELLVIFFSMVPISELRGAIPLGISLGLSPIHSTIISICGNILIVPILLKILHPLIIFFEDTFIFKYTIGVVKNKAIKKADSIKTYSLIGLFLFVAIPLPTSGAWTASVIASVLKLDKKKAFISIALGIIVAGLIILGVSVGAIKMFD
jgi:uncharacterized membrane protein